jgi:hypothetical protein
MSLEDDKHMLRQLILGHAAKALGGLVTVYAQENSHHVLIRNLAYDCSPVVGPVRNEDLFDYLVSLQAQLLFILLINLSPT